MAIDLPGVDDRTLAHPPLAVVVCQIRYEQNLGVGDGDTGLSIHEDLGGREGDYPTIEPQQIMSAQIEMGPAGLASLGAAAFPRRGWRMRSSDKKWIVSLMPDHVTLETTNYTTWRSDFRPRLAALLDSVSRNIKPSVLERVGLRYVNRLSDSQRTSASDWRGAVRDELLGPVADPFWSTGVETFQAQADLDLGDDRRCLFRQGVIVDDSEGVEGYLLDYDVYRQVPRRFDSSDLMEVLNGFNQAALTLFHRSITPEYLAELRTE